MTTAAELLAQGRQAHQAGRVAEAERLYQQVLKDQPAHAEALYLLGAAAQSQGRLDEAVARLQAAVAARSRHAPSHNHLGVALAQQGKLDEAIEEFRQALRLHPAWPEAHSNLGNALRDKGGIEKYAVSFRPAPGVRLDYAHLFSDLGNRLYRKRLFREANLSYEQALYWNPDHAEVLNNRGIVLSEEGQLTEAIRCFERAIKLKPDYADAHNNLAVILRRQGRLPAAAECLRKVLQLKPDYAEAHNNLGIILTQLEQHAEAEAALRAAIRSRPNFAEAYNNLGLTFMEQGKLADAITHLQEAVRLRPEYVEAHNNLAAAYTEQGRPEEAIGQLHETLRLKPDYAGAFYNLAEIVAQNRYRFRDDERQQMERLLAQSPTAKDASLLAFALAIAHDKAKEYDTAFGYFRHANDWLKKAQAEKGLTFDVAKHAEFIGQLIAAFGEDYFRRVRTFGIDSEVPIFIVGMPRSGTSLVEQILASHSQVFGAGELPDIRQHASGLRQRLQSKEAYPLCAPQITAPAARAMAQQYLDRVAQLSGGAARVTDKRPGNILHLGLITTLFPRARVIHCRRDPMDTCVSCYLQNFRDVNFTQDLADIGAYYRHYERLVRHWAKVLPIAVHEVHYEELVANQEAESRKLVAFCGLEWDDRCLQFHETERAVHTASKLQVRQPMYRSSVGRWKRFEKHLQPLIAALQGA